MRIGIDFDNTIINYDDVFLEAAKERGLIAADFAGTSKQAVRDPIRLLPDGEMTWQRLQGFVYSKGIAHAVMFGGVDRFLRRAKREGHAIPIVSHKTEFGHLDPDRTNLRHAALDWMTQHNFFSSDGYGIQRQDVYFESTRAEKLARIASLGCACFIDDREEVLDDKRFPSAVKPVLFAAATMSGHPPAYALCPTWDHVEKMVLGERD